MMHGPAGIRHARAEDEVCWLALWDAFTSAEPESCEPGAGAVLWRRILDPDNPLRCLIAEQAGRAVGFAVFLAHPYSWSTRPVGYLLDLYVAPEARRQGRARALIDALAAIGHQEGWFKVTWMAEPDNRAARALYDKVAVRSPFVRYDMVLAAE